MTTRTVCYFKVYEDQDGKFRWHFLAPCDRIMAESGRSYATRQACVDSVNEIVREAIPGVTISYDASAAAAALGRECSYGGRARTPG
jgi:uncharacterized protein YegP (UPF0339 family)